MPRQDTLQDVRAHPDVIDILPLVERLDFIARRMSAPNTNYAEFSTATNTSTGVLLVAENEKRRSLVVFNNSGADVYIHTRQLNGNNALHWLRIADTGYWEPIIPPTNAIYAIGTAGAQIVFGYEGV